MTDQAIKKLRREIATRPLCEPGPDQYVGACHWSRTGWAVHEADGRCTCQPTTAVKLRPILTSGQGK